MAKKKVASDSPEEAVKAPAASEEVKAAAPEVTPVAEAPKAETPLPSEAKVAVGSKAEVMRDKLKAEPKVRVLIPLAPGEKAGVTQSVILNGYSLYIRKGDYVDVPQSVAEVLEIKMKQKMFVDQHPLKADGDGDVKMTRFGS